MDLSPGYIDKLAYRILKQALGNAQKQIDQELLSIAKKVIYSYYDDYDPKPHNRHPYRRTFNFWKKSYYLSHRHTNANGRYYRYIDLNFSPDKMDEVYTTYGSRRNPKSRFPKNVVFDQNFIKGWHGREVRGHKSKPIYGRHRNKPIQILDELWDELDQENKGAFIKMMDDSVEKAMDDILQEVNENVIAAIGKRFRR